MIGTIDVNIQAARPDFPLTPFKAFVNSPSSVRVRNVPKKIGKWDVTKVYVNANYPDNMVRSAECVLTAGIWVGTIAASTSVGTSLNGYTITADGTDENGAAVSGYILGKGDVEILDADGTITIGETTYYVHICDTQPTSPKKGDLCKITGVWELYNGTQWETLGGGGGGTSNYNQLTNKPQIGGVTLQGNKTAADLSLVTTSDSRLTDARTPTAHKSSHATNGADALAPADIGAVPTTRKVNNQTLDADITLTAANVGADPAGSAATAKAEAIAACDPAGAAATAKNQAIAACDPAGSAASAVSGHNTAANAHSSQFAAKQDTISDLATIRSGAEAGATAVQPAAMTTALAAKLSDNTADYLSSSAYAVGAFCKYNGALYVCKVAIASGGEAWTPAHWEAMPNVSTLFSVNDVPLVNTIKATVPATALKATEDSGEYQLDPGSANPWDNKVSTISCGSGESKQTIPAVLGDADITNLFSGANMSLVAVCRQYGGTQIKQDDQGNFYYEVEEE